VYRASCWDSCVDGCHSLEQMPYLSGLLAGLHIHHHSLVLHVLSQTHLLSLPFSPDQILSHKAGQEILLKCKVGLL
jgi:hypothetical protein